MFILDILKEAFDPKPDPFIELYKDGKKLGHYRMKDEGFAEFNKLFSGNTNGYLEGFHIKSDKPVKNYLPMLEKKMQEISCQIEFYDDYAGEYDSRLLPGKSKEIVDIRMGYENAMHGVDKAIAIINNQSQSGL